MDEKDLEYVDVTVCVRVTVPVIVAVIEPVTGVIDGVMVEVTLIDGDTLFDRLTEAMRLLLTLCVLLRVSEAVELNDIEDDFVMDAVVE